MRSQKELKMWGIFYTRNTKRDAESFERTMKQCLDQFSFDTMTPRFIEVENDRDFRSWERIFKDNLNDKVQFVVFILPG